MGGFYGISHYVAIGITGDLRRCLLEEFLHLLFRGARLAIFQFDDVALFRLYILHLYVVPTEILWKLQAKEIQVQESLHDKLQFTLLSLHIPDEPFFSYFIYEE